MTAIVPLYFLVGVVIALIGLAIYRIDGKNEKRCTLRTAGYILDNVNSRNLYFPLIAYEIDGTNYTAQYKTGTKKVKYIPKQNVPLRVNPDDHMDIYIENIGPTSYKQQGKCLICIGLVIIVTAVLAIFL